MFTLANLELGQSVSNEFLNTLIENQNFTKHGNMIVGEIVQWVGGDSVESIHHLEQAPNGTCIYAREEYFGSAEFTRNNGEWFVTNIRVWSV